jgi:hypothetical protein
MTKRLSKKQSNSVKAYLDDQEHLDFLRNMHAAGFDAASTYIRFLIKKA